MQHKTALTNNDEGGNESRSGQTKAYLAVTAVTEPPAASIFSCADLENLSAVTLSLTLNSPSPNTLTGWF